MFNERICPQNFTQYVVKKGDTLWQLAKTYGVSVQSIMNANPGINADNLQEGNFICIPTAGTHSQVESSQITACQEGSIAYTVKPGDTFWKLSQTYGISLQSLIDANPDVPINNLQVGSTICIPTAAKKKPAPPPTPVACPEGSISYTVKPGDTFWKLSRVYGVSLQSLVDANPGVPANNLQVGSTICIPAAAEKKPAPPPTPVACPEGSISYTVKPGDTFWNLSRIYGVSVQSIVDLNPGVNADNLQVGSTICIPVAEKAPEEIQPKPVPEPTRPQIKPRTCPKGTFPYTIEAGDTLWQLALNFGVGIQKIIDLNPGINAYSLQAGSTICIPIAEEAPVAEEQFVYKVKECDTICSIARKFYVSVDSILMKNPGINPRCLQPGTSLYIPLNCCASNTFRYAVSAGDNLYKIANRFNVCPASIIAANPNVDFNNLVRCQVICIPSR